MNSTEADELLDAFISELASTIGFERINSDCFGRQEHDATAMISFPRWHSVHSICHFTAWVGLRYLQLAEWLDEDSEDTPPTIAQRLHLLREKKDYVEWEFSSDKRLDVLRDAVLTDLKTYAIPFVERYSQLTNLRKALESSDKRDWINVGLNVDSRVTVLAAIQLLEGDKGGALRRLDEGLVKLEEALASKPQELRKRRRQFDRLRARILANR